MIDFRIYVPEDDGKSKTEHVMDMLQRLLEKERQGQLAFRGVLMDTWYATNRLMLRLHRAGKVFCCPVRKNRTLYLPDGNTDRESARWRADSIVWNEETLAQGQVVRLNRWPAGCRVRMFRLVLSEGGTELVVTNDPAVRTTDDVRQTHAVRWAVEVFHRQLKQVTGIEACQCRLGRSQRNHIGCALLVWITMTVKAKQMGRTIYSLKAGLLDAYMRAELANPSIRFA